MTCPHSQIAANRLRRGRTLRAAALLSPTHSEEAVVAPLRVAITRRAAAFGASGLLGADFLSRIARVAYAFGPPDALVLEES